ncbi:alkaline phosphatase, partial [Bacillus cereus]
GGYWLGGNLQDIFGVLEDHIGKIIFGVIVIVAITLSVRFRKQLKRVFLQNAS